MARRVVASRVRFVRYPPKARGGDAPVPVIPVSPDPAAAPPDGALVLPGPAWLVLPGDATLALPD